MSCSHGGWGWQELQLTSSLQSQSLQKAERGCQELWRVLVRVLVRSFCEPAETNAAAFPTSAGPKADLAEVQMRMCLWGQGYADALGFQTRTFLLNYKGRVPITWMLPAHGGVGACAEANVKLETEGARFSYILSVPIHCRTSSSLFNC